MALKESDILGGSRVSKVRAPKTAPVDLVPVVINVSEAGLGLRKGEVRGLHPEMAERMIKAGSALPYKAQNEAAAKAEARKEVAEGDKAHIQS